MSLPPEFLDELRGRIGLAQLIGRRVKLLRAGREMKGCCPFHQEKTPSFYVNEDKGFYHCFGCGAHGDAIGFLMAHDGLDFMGAVRSLAAEAGLTVPETRRPGPEAERRGGLSDLVAAAGDWFRAQLAAPGGAAARAYLAGREVTPAIQALFGLGFAPDSRDALSVALTARFPAMAPADLIEAGLAGESEGRRYDRFRGRLIFPIHDSRGRPVGFGGRALGDAQPKYLNSPEGPVFRKGRLLYNLHRAAPAARQAGRLLIVEGYMDVVGLAGAGIAEAVAPLGTALTDEQMALAWRLVPEPILAFDGDAAGRRAALRAATRALPLLAAGRSLLFLTLPQGRDPDDIARAGGRAAVEALLAGAQPLARFLFEAELSAGPLDTPERRAAFRGRLKALAGEIADPDLRRDYLASWRTAADAALALTPATRRGSGRSPAGPPATWQLPVRPETRAAAAARPDELATAMLLRRLADEPALAADHLEPLAELPIASPVLALARDHLLAGRPAQALLRCYRASSIEPERIGDTLATLMEAHHMGRHRQQGAGPDDVVSWEVAQARNRAAAQDYLGRIRALAGLRQETGEA